MWISSYSGIMNYNLLCNRIMRCLKIRLYISSKAAFTRYSKHSMSHIVPGLCHFPKELHMSKTCNNDSIEETEESELTLPLQRGVGLEDHSEQFRNTLYANSNDLLILQIKSCDSIKELFSTINENMHPLTPEHCCQILLVLYDILHVNNCLAYGTSLVTLTKRIESELPKPLPSVVLSILDPIKNDVEKLTPEELVCCLLYSKRLGINLKHPSAQTIVTQINSLLSKQDVESFSITALSRLTIVFDNQNELWARLFLVKTLPLIYMHFDICQSIEEFRALTISMLSTVYYLREELLVEYKVLAEEFLTKGLLTREHSSVIVKAVMLLNNVYYDSGCRQVIYKLLHMLHGHLDKMFLPHILEVQKVVSYQAEPHNTIVDLYNFKRSHLCLTPCDDFHLPLVHLPANSKGSQFFKEFITKSHNVDCLLNAQVHLTTAQPDVCHLYWNKVANVLQLVVPGDVHTLARVCYRYMNFSTRMSLYRHRQFESTALSLVTRELVAGTTVMQPKLFALLATFVLMVDSGRGNGSLSSEVVLRLMTIVGQLDPQSCLWISRALGERLRRTKDVHVLLQVDSVLSLRTKELLKNVDPGSIEMFNTFLRSCINRKQSMESDVMQDVISRFWMLDWSRLTSRSLRNLIYNLHITSILLPTALEHMVEYCLNNNEYILVDTVGKLLFLCYSLGYTPTHVDSLCSLAADLASRDSEMLNGLSLLQVALALSYFNHLSSSLVRVIFTVHFLERLDEEIKHCFAKDKYPQRVRQTLMMLNRSVCLDQPEADVPWFHSKFCEEQKAIGQLEVVPKSLLFTDVYATMLKLVGDPDYIGTKTYTPYGYVLDMQLNLDASLNPVPFKSTENVVHKLALLLYYGNCYTAFEKRLKGFHLMKRRHLEILGYRVIGLSDSTWNAMFMSEPKVKLEYLRNLIWPS